MPKPRPEKFPHDGLKTHCIHGHSMADAYVVHPTNQPRRRHCKTCHRLRQRVYQRKRRRQGG